VRGWHTPLRLRILTGGLLALTWRDECSQWDLLHSVIRSLRRPISFLIDERPWLVRHHAYPRLVSHVCMSTHHIRLLESELLESAILPSSPSRGVPASIATDFPVLFLWSV
jgi:hypothetical protein